jgi:hypothetical protein
MNMRLFMAVLAWGLVASSAHGQDVFLKNVNGYTLQDGSLQRFDALLVRDGKVQAAGSAALLEPYAKAGTVRDMGGKTVLPGFIDSHAHVTAYGQNLVRIDLRPATSLTAALEIIVAQLPKRGWVLGGGWNQENWDERVFPSALALDAVTGERPAALTRVDGHALWVNTAALSAAGITASTPDPAGGRIERNADGTATGILVDAAMGLVTAILPQPDTAQTVMAISRAAKALNAHGVTMVHDAGVTPDQWFAMRQLADEKALPIRIYAMIAGLGEAYDVLSSLRPIASANEDRLMLRAVKLYADGALGSRGAALKSDYADQPGNKGLLFEDPTALRNKIARGLLRGYQINIHAIGNAANSQVVSAFKDVLAIAGTNGRHRIEHVQVIDAEDRARMAALGLIASIQPIHATSDRLMAMQRLDEETIKGAYAYRAMADSGIALAAGSDVPVEPPNPFLGMLAAVARVDARGEPKGGWRLDDALSLEQAFTAYTMGGAYAAFMENRLGSLEPRKWADFVVVDRDIFAIAPKDLGKTRVLETWVAGERVFALKK